MTDAPSTLAGALVAAMADLTDPVKDGKVAAGQRRYTYLTLPALLTETRNTLGRHGLCAVQEIESTEQGVAVGTIIVHTSGEEMRFPPLVIKCAQDAQSIGSAITYGRRYTLSAALGLAGSDDDDGAHASRPQEPSYDTLTRPVTRTQGVPEEDPWYPPDAPLMPPHAAPAVHRPDDAASQKQIGAIKGICQTLGIGALKSGDYARWVLKRDNPTRPDDLLLTKGEASKVIEASQGDAGKALAQEFLGAML